MFSLFNDAISLLYALRSLYVLQRLFKNWRAFWDAEVSAADRALANDLAFFVFIPLGVFLHEAGHALATWQVGGQVAEFQWRVFWGFIVPSGTFTPVQDWWIAFSGPLVSILIGLVPISFLLWVRRGVWSELLYAYIKHELFYALVWYPVLSFIGFGGDWVKIYDFSISPYAQITLGVHLALLFSLWRLNQSAWVSQWRLAREPEAWAAWQQLQAEARASPGAVKPLAQLAFLADRMKEHALASHYLKQAKRVSPDHPEVKVAQAFIAYGRKEYRQATTAAEAALAGNLAPQVRANLHRILAFSFMEAGRQEKALAQFNLALDSSPTDSNLYYWRAILKRAMRRRDEACLDFEAAAQHASDDDDRAQAQRELEYTRQAVQRKTR